MSWKNWFGRKAPGATQSESSEHCVKVHLKLSEPPYGTEDERDSVHRLSDRLAEAIMVHAAGEFDGDEFGDGECVLYMYGPNADRLLASILPVLKDRQTLLNGRIIKRFGPPGSRSEEIDLDTIRPAS